MMRPPVSPATGEAEAGGSQDGAQAGQLSRILWVRFGVRPLAQHARCPVPIPSTTKSSSEPNFAVSLELPSPTWRWQPPFMLYDAWASRVLARATVMSLMPPLATPPGPVSRATAGLLGASSQHRNFGNVCPASMGARRGRAQGTAASPAVMALLCAQPTSAQPLPLGQGGSRETWAKPGARKLWGREGGTQGLSRLRTAVQRPWGQVVSMVSAVLGERSYVALEPQEGVVSDRVQGLCLRSLQTALTPPLPPSGARHGALFQDTVPPGRGPQVWRQTAEPRAGERRGCSRAVPTQNPPPHPIGGRGG